MILVDTSVWIDFHRGVDSPTVLWLRDSVDEDEIIVGDLVLMEILQGYRDDRTADLVAAELRTFRIVAVAGADIVEQAARNYRLLRAKGITVRSTIDTLIATRCIHEGWSLLHRDRDYEPFVTHLGLRPALRLS